jgi:hypothetical protein
LEQARFGAKRKAEGDDVAALGRVIEKAGGEDDAVFAIFAFPVGALGSL